MDLENGQDSEKSASKEGMYFKKINNQSYLGFFFHSMNDEMMMKMNSSISFQAFSGNAYSQGHNWCRSILPETTSNRAENNLHPYW